MYIRCVMFQQKLSALDALQSSIIIVNGKKISPTIGWTCVASLRHRTSPLEPMAQMTSGWVGEDGGSTCSDTSISSGGPMLTQGPCVTSLHFLHHSFRVAGYHEQAVRLGSALCVCVCGCVWVCACVHLCVSVCLCVCSCVRDSANIISTAGDQHSLLV